MHVRKVREGLDRNVKSMYCVPEAPLLLRPTARVPRSYVYLVRVYLTFTTVYTRVMALD